MSKLRLEIRKRFLIVRGRRFWNSLSVEIVGYKKTTELVLKWSSVSFMNRVI